MQKKTPRKAISLFVIAVLLLSILPTSLAAVIDSEEAVLIPPDESGVMVTYSAYGGNVTMEEGKTVTVSAGVSGTVTWSSSNTTVATVSSTGVITSIRAGTATVTASVNGVASKFFQVYVHLKNGVYWISSANPNLLLSADAESISNGTQVELHSLYSGLPNNLLQLWKIYHLGSGLYSVRPMHKLNMALDVTEEAVDIWTAGTTDNFSAVPSSCQWYIFYDMDGYVFVYDEGGVALTYNPSAGEGATLYCDEYVETDATFQWTVTPLPGSMNGIVFFDTNNNELCTNPTFYPELGQTKTLANLGYLPSVYSSETLEYDIDWESDNESVAIVNNTTGVMTGVSRNDATVSVTVTLGAQAFTNHYALAVEETIYVVNLYDSTLTNDATRLGYIDEAIAFLNTIYREDYNLHFTQDGSPQLHLDSTITACTYGLTAGCSTEVCGNTCINHHKNLNRIANRLYSSFWSENHIVVKWSNHAKGIFCNRNSLGEHKPSQAYAVNTYVNGVPQPIIQFINIDSGANDNIEAFMAVQLAHEVAHSLGLKEVYNGSYNQNDIVTHLEYYKDEENPMPCIMAGVVKDKINGLYGKDEEALCDLCRGYLASEIPDDAYAD